MLAEAGGQSAKIAHGNGEARCTKFVCLLFGDTPVVDVHALSAELTSGGTSCGSIPLTASALHAGSSAALTMRPSVQSRLCSWQQRIRRPKLPGCASTGTSCATAWTLR